MNARNLMAAAMGLAILTFVIGLGLALWWLVYFDESLFEALLLVAGVAVALFALAAVRHRASIGWTVLFLAAFSLLFVSVMSPLGLGPFSGPMAMLLLALCMWVLLRPAGS